MNKTVSKVRVSRLERSYRYLAFCEIAGARWRAIHNDKWADYYQGECERLRRQIRRERGNKSD